MITNHFLNTIEKDEVGYKKHQKKIRKIFSRNEL